MKKNQQQLFQLKEDQQGVGQCVHAWTPDCRYIASSGVNRVIHLLDRQGHQYKELALETLGAV